MRIKVFSILFFSLVFTSLSFSQSGKIAGRVVDDAGLALPGATVLIEGTTTGTASGPDGYYTILNVSPGNYTVIGSFIGFSSQKVTNVQVNINLTSSIDFQLSEETYVGEEVVVTAERPVVLVDVASSQANISAEQIESKPVSSISEVVGLQAGIQGLSVRGSGSDELAINVNGLSLKDERSNTSFSGISLASVEAVQVLTGGFNAEYGNVRSGVIDVVTKEGSPDSYSITLINRYTPPQQRHFGPKPNDPNGYWIRPFLDEDVAWTGTKSGAWSEDLQSQYPIFEGWNSISEKLVADSDPTNDLTPQALQQAFRWQHRKVFETTLPDYNIDLGFGGPIPGLKNKLGNLRFFASYRRDQSMYMIPLSADRQLSHTGHLKLTSDLAPGMKLSIEGLMTNASGTSSSRSGAPGIFSAAGMASSLSRVSFIDARMFSSDYWAPTSVASNLIGAKFTHAVNDKSYYEVRFTRYESKYDTNPAALRDSTVLFTVGGVGFDEGPFGFQPNPSFGVNGMRMGVGFSGSRDSSETVSWSLKGDYTIQLNRFMEIKSGIEANVTDSRVNYANFDAFLRSGNSQSKWNRTPVRGGAYAQTKLEFKGMVANLGLRADYFHAGGQWYVLEDVFTDDLGEGAATRIDTSLVQRDTDHIVTISPRLGVSFPVTTYSKLFFNYGHFRSMPDPNNLYLLRTLSENGKVTRIANPNNPLPRTISYELGYEHSLYEQYHIKMTGYYKDVSLQPRLVRFISRNGLVDYTTTEPDSYEDIRGFEITFEKIQGRWFQGMINYTYMVYTNGLFGFGRENQNTTIQDDYENSESVQLAASSKPLPRPFARASLDFIVPSDFGPEVLGQKLLADWRLTTIMDWRQGAKLTWTGGGAIAGVSRNVQMVDYFNLNLRITKNFRIGNTKAQFFADVFNTLNTKRLSFNGFVDGNDYLSYFRSLHLPKSENYSNLVGDDLVGAYRDNDVEFVPLTGISARTEFNLDDQNTVNSITDRIYFESGSGQYIRFSEGAWSDVPSSEIDQIIEDKAYIDMPNQKFLTFLNPRSVFFGFRLSF